jgi:opacity protein-like surface antigen
MDNMRRVGLVALAVAMLILGAGTARAQGFFSVSGGYAYDGAAGECPSLWNDCPNRPTSWSLAAGSTGKILGFEAEYSWASDFFGKGGDLESSKVTTMMSNFLIGVPLGPVRPYGMVGLGLMKASMEFKSATNLSAFSDTSWGLNYGAGVILLLPAHIGFRLDYRRFSSSSDIPYAGPVPRAGNSFVFSRATIGVVLH